MSIGPLFAALLGEAEASQEVTPLATLATPATLRAESRRVAKVAAGAPFPRELAERVQAMTARWQYSPEELAWALDQARADPAGWLSAVTVDEELAAACERGGVRWPV